MIAAWLLPLALLAAEPRDWPYFVEKNADAELAVWALEAWEKAAEGKIRLKRVATADDALLQVVHATGQSGQYGEAVPVMINGRRGVRLFIRSGTFGGADKLLRDTIVYLTVLHEAGHAFGLRHTRDFADIMYSFQYGGDLAEYFNRYRRKIARREDIRQHSGIAPGDLRQLKAILAE
jgi:hypothetical protein